MKIKNINNVVIDLGGVMINLDRERCVKAFETLGLKGVDSMLGLYRQEEPFLSIETGRCTGAEFYDRLRALTGKPIPDTNFEDAFNAFLVSLPIERLRALQKMRSEGYKLYMISNTNVIMYDGWIKRAFMQEGLRVGDYFDGIITSFAEGVCKPDPAIFTTLIKRYGLKPEESILLDDSESNCKTAQQLGMQALRIIGNITITNWQDFV